MPFRVQDRLNPPSYASLDSMYMAASVECVMPKSVLQILLDLLY